MRLSIYKLDTYLDFMRTGKRQYQRVPSDQIGMCAAAKLPSRRIW